jgi:DNA-directed RNA polymerase specialized sigma24 family protein
MNVDQMEAAARSDDPAVGFRAVAALRRMADQLEQSNVATARLEGWSWEQIGDALGVSKQAAHKKYRSTP